MLIFFEGQAYTTCLLEKYFNKHTDCYALLPKQEGYSKLVCVGYYYCADEDEHIYILPKVFIYKKHGDNEQKAFGEIQLNSRDPICVKNSIKKSSLLSSEWKEDILYRLPLWLYSAIKKYYHKKNDTRILDKENLLDVIASRKEEKNLSQLDIALAINSFYKKHTDFFVFHYQESHKGYNKINWNKTVRKETPIVQSSSVYYISHVNRKKDVDYEEELIILFYNTLQFIYTHFFIDKFPDTDYQLYSDREFENMMKNGVIKRKLWNIKENYYNEILVQMWDLLNKFHQEHHQSGSGKRDDDFLIAKSFDRVFEDMIDELISDPLEAEFKNLKDDKTIDHLFLCQNVFDNSNSIFYIGDSKYYKPNEKPTGPAKYKQFTYAKNIIQMAIEWYREGPSANYINKKLNYVDTLTEGYNLTPNFFISGIVQPEYKFTSNVLKPVMNNGKFEEFHITQWDNRLFDRDTLYALMYEINFLFVLYSYINKSHSSKKRFKTDARDKFRNNFSDFLDDTYKFYLLSLKEDSSKNIKEAIHDCFYDIKGKLFMPYIGNDLLIMALDENNYPEDSNKAKSSISKYFVLKIVTLADLRKMSSISKNPC